MNYDAILFDLDGTLFDTSGDILNAVKNALVEVQRPHPPESALRRQINRGSRALLCFAYGCEDTPEHAALIADLHARYSRHYLAALARHSRWFAGMEALVCDLERAGVPWGIVTNKAEVFTRPLMVELGLDTRLAVLVCGDTTPAPKPSPQPLWYACAKIGVAPEKSIFIGDSATDIAAGRAAGLKTVACAYGFTPEGESPQAWGADWVIAAPSELRAILGLNS